MKTLQSQANAVDVEKIVEGIEGIIKGRTLNYHYYYE